MTVRHALGQGREVFVVPGSIEGPFAEGTNQLLRDGARPIRNAQDVIEDLGFQAGPGADPTATRSPRASESAGPGSIETRILAMLEDGPATRDTMLVQLGLDAGRLASALLELELAGRVVEERDGRIHPVWG